MHKWVLKRRLKWLCSKVIILKILIKKSCNVGGAGKYIDFSSKFCVSSCYTNNPLTVLDSSSEKCVDICQANEYKDTTLR